MTIQILMDTPIEAVGNGLLFRAIVCLPPAMANMQKQSLDRIVFFEAPGNENADQYLEELLAKAWCIDTTGWIENYYIQQVFSVAELRCMSSSTAPATDLQLFELGTGGSESSVVMGEKIRYARSSRVDLFVSPRLGMRLRDALDTIDSLYMTKAASSGVRRCSM
jgi:hypothetical protein